MDPLANSCGADVEDAGDVAPREIRVGRAEPEPGELGEALFRVHAAATRADVIGADAVVGDFVDECAVAVGAGTPGGAGIQPVRFAQPAASSSANSSMAGQFSWAHSRLSASHAKASPSGRTPGSSWRQRHQEAAHVAAHEAMEALVRGVPPSQSSRTASRRKGSPSSGRDPPARCIASTGTALT